MQPDYYHSPIRTQEPVPAVPPLPAGGYVQRRRNQRRVPTALIVFLALILFLSVLLGVLRLLDLNGALNWDWYSEKFSQRFDFDRSDPGGFVDPFDKDEFDFRWDSSDTTSSTTIPRAELAPDVQLLLQEQTGRALSFPEIYDKVIPSIVSIQALGDEGGFEGTGVVMTADGYVVTNYHIIDGCSQAAVVLADGIRYEAKLVGCDAESDLAVLKVTARGLVPAEFGDSDLLQVGESVVAIGNPLGSQFFGTMTEGIVSAINRDVTVEGYDMSLIQTTAALNPGNSGGALINSFGQVVGITNMKMMSDYETIEGLGFAIPTTSVRDVVNTLLAEGAITGRPTIGIMCFALQSGYEEEYGRDSGVYISKITPRGPAEKAGVKVGDVILEANGRTIETLEDLTVARDEAGVGGELKLTLWRDGETLELTLILVEQYELD